MRWKCLLCGRMFTCKSPHKCGGNFRKHKSTRLSVQVMDEIDIIVEYITKLGIGCRFEKFGASFRKGGCIYDIREPQGTRLTAVVVRMRPNANPKDVDVFNFINVDLCDPEWFGKLDKFIV